jgi:hypothetical protein
MERYTTTEGERVRLAGLAGLPAAAVRIMVGVGVGVGL